MTTLDRDLAWLGAIIPFANFILLGWLLWKTRR